MQLLPCALPHNSVISCFYFFIIFSIILYLAQMEVGIEDCLHIEFEYNKSK